MKFLLLLLVCCVISTSLAGLIDKETKLETVLNEVDEILQDLKAEKADDVVPAPQGDIQKLESMLNEALIEGDVSPTPSHKQGSSAAMEEMLLHTENIDKATAEVKAAGGRVILQLGHNLLVTNVPSQVAKQNSFTQASTHIPSSASAQTLSHANAYWMSRENELKPPPTVQVWTERMAPMAFKREDSDEGFQGNSPYRATLTGKIAVLMILVSGPGSIELSDAERTKVISEVQDGAKFWEEQADVAGIDLSFTLYSTKISLTASNPIKCYNTPYCHNVFADRTYNAFGFPSGQTGRDKLAQHIKDIAGADGAVLAFFSKYRQSHFAYAYFGGGPMYMQYSNDGWGPDQIDKVFAHELGHVFNAPDEYTKCACAQQYGGGTCTAKNSNCKDCASSQSECVMNSNSLKLCADSKKHVGWC